MRKRGRPRIFGIIGESLSHTLSPQIHNYLFRKLGLECSYHAFEVKGDNLNEALQGIRVLGIGGVNVTFPYKEETLHYLDEMDLDARRTGAVNTIRNVKGKLVGYNTDVFGIRSTLEGRLKVKLEGKQVFLLGAGGAARACLWELLRHKPRKLLLLNRTPGNAQSMVAAFRNISADTEIEIRPLSDVENLDLEERADLLINATSAGVAVMEGILKIISRKHLSRGARILDLNYNQRALSRKIVTPHIEYVDGLYMLSCQAAESFRIWTGISPDPMEIFRYISKKSKER